MKQEKRRRKHGVEDREGQGEGERKSGRERGREREKDIEREGGRERERERDCTMFKASLRFQNSIQRAI